MNLKFTIVDFCSLSIAIAAIIAIIRFPRINKVYLPFIICIWLAFANELLSYFLAYSGHYTAINNNLYVLAESLLITWQFQQWKLFERNQKLFFALLLLFVIAWVIDGTLLSGFGHTITFFRIFYSFIIVLMSILRINKALITDRETVLKNAGLLISFGFVIYFMFKVITGVFWLYGFGGSSAFRMNMAWILIYINAFVNLIYALAVLWMPGKLRFSLPF